MISLIRKILTKITNDSAHDHLLISSLQERYSLAAQGKIEEAIAQYELALKLQPNAQDYLDLGNLLIQRNKVDEALENYNQALALKLDWAEAYYYRGNAWYGKEEYGKAIQDYQKAIDLSLNWESLFLQLSTAFAALGKLKKEQGDLEGAIISYQEAIEIQKINVNVKSKLSELYVSLGNCLLENDNVNKALEIYKKAIFLNPSKCDLYNQLGVTLFRNNNIEQAIENYKLSLEINPSYTEAYINLGNAYVVAGNRKAALYSYYQANKLRLDIKTETKLIPGILLNTLPKSGTVYILNALTKGLKINFMRISGNSFPDDLIVREKIQQLALGNCLTAEHLPANLVNLNLISEYLDKLIIHLRDPRQALLSWVNFLNKLKSKDPQAILSYAPSLFFDKYFFISFEEQISWQIEQGYLQAGIQFIETWLKAAENKDFHPKILFTRHEDLVENSKQFFNFILDFYEIDPMSFSFPDKPIPGQGHYRKGEIDEWRKVFNPEQIEKATSMMPDYFFSKFGWTK